MHGALAQLVAHDTGSVGVRGSNPLRSKNKRDTTSISFIFGVSWYENSKLEFGASELRAKVLSLEQAKLVKRKTVDPLHANEQEKSPTLHF